MGVRINLVANRSGLRSWQQSVTMCLLFQSWILAIDKHNNGTWFEFESVSDHRRSRLYNISIVCVSIFQTKFHLIPLNSITRYIDSFPFVSFKRSNTFLRVTRFFDTFSRHRVYSVRNEPVRIPSEKGLFLRNERSCTVFVTL